MRLAYKVWSGIAAGVFCLVAVTDLGNGSNRPAIPAASSSSSSASPTPTPTPALPAVASAPVGENVAVLQVIDGDSFRLADGREVRVLGIDSCEAATPGGARATAEARTRLLGVDVLLTTEPGVGNDRYGRMLRYVSADGTDYAAAMVVADHTAIYTDGRNDASPAVQASLRRLDTNGRVCGSPVTSTSSSPVPDPDPDVDRPRTPRAAPLAPRTRTSANPAPSGGSAYYANCSAARAAGAAPIRAGQPGYRAALDRDGDGTACDT